MSDPNGPPKNPRLIAGLGNPGREYADTRHNVGFMIVDALASQFNAVWSLEKRWDCSLAKFAGGWLMKPHTYMNGSGRAAQSVCHFYKLTPQEVFVIYDDVDLPLGSLRIRPKGSAAGHNGLRSLIEHLGTDEFPRLKAGIAPGDGRPAGDRMIGHVLGKFSTEEQPALQEMVSRAVHAVRMTLDSGLEATMNLFNRKEQAPKPDQA